MLKLLQRLEQDKLVRASRNFDYYEIRTVGQWNVRSPRTLRDSDALYDNTHRPY